MPPRLYDTGWFDLTPNGLPMAFGRYAVDIVAPDARTSPPHKVAVIVENVGEIDRISVSWEARQASGGTRLIHQTATVLRLGISGVVAYHMVLDPQAVRRGRKRRSGVTYNLRVYVLPTAPNKIS
jgi:hypothetical protein